MFSVWLFSREYIENCRKELGFGFEDIIFLVEGDLATVFRDNEKQKEFVRYLSEKTLNDQKFRKNCLKEYYQIAEKLNDFIKMDIEEFMTKENLNSFIEQHKRFIAYFLVPLWSPNGFDKVDAQEDLKKKLFKEFEEARKATERLYPELEKFLQKIFENISKKTKVESKFLRALLPNEILDYVINGNIPDAKKLKERYDYCVVLADINDSTLVLGQKARDIIKKITFIENRGINEIKGTIANKGIIRGKVKKIFMEKEMGDFETGDILVTTMTRPEWLPIMKKAGGFVTDAGGILSHAAIVSRELNKPCIIGTGIATQILQNGDEVEVDANKGEVRIIKRAEENYTPNFKKILSRKLALLTDEIVINAWNDLARCKKLTGLDEYVENMEVINGDYCFDTNWTNKITQKYQSANLKLFWNFINQGYLCGEKVKEYSKNLKIALTKDGLQKQFNESVELLKNLLVFLATTHPLVKAVENNVIRILKSKGITDEKINETLLEVTYPIKKNTPVLENENLLAIRNANYSEKELEKAIREHTKRFSFLGYREPFSQGYNLDFFKMKYKNQVNEEHKPLMNIKFTQEEQKYINLMKEFVYFRNYRTEKIYESLFYLEILWRHIAKTFNLKEDVDLGWYFLNEIDELFAKGKQVSQEELLKRKMGHAVLLHNNHITYLFGKAMENYRAKNYAPEEIKVSQLTGVSACKGKVRGIVKVLLSSKEQCKILTGDILVTPMTTPDLLPSMNRAAAFITDEGGITCHAAIVSRELNKPCIIGTKNATTVLHDGDLVEVDANKGVVRVIKKVEEHTDNFSKMMIQAKDEKDFNLDPENKYFQIVSRRTSIISRMFIQIGYTNNHFYQKMLGYPTKYSVIYDNDRGIYINKVASDNEREEIIKRFEKNPQFISKTMANGEKKCNELLTFSDNLKKINLNKLSDEELKEITRKFCELECYASSFIMFPLAIQSWLESRLKEELKKNNVEESFPVFITPIKNNAHYYEQIEILNLAIKYCKNKIIDKYEIKNYLDKYGPMAIKYGLGNPWTEEDVKERIISLSKENPAKKLAELIDFHKKAEKEVKELLLKIKADKQLIDFINVLRTCIWFRTFRTDVYSQSVAKAFPLFDEIAKRNNLTRQEIISCFPSEITTFNFPSRKIIQERAKNIMINARNGKLVYIYGEKVEAILNKVKQLAGVVEEKDIPKTNEIKGTPAFGGVIRGKVKIVFNNLELKKVQRGDILVASMTTPDFITAMERAAAFVTDEGGILCHAAIVSREMKKPCVIGTKVATKILQDGDEVEVDANKGEIRVIKSTSQQLKPIQEVLDYIKKNNFEISKFEGDIYWYNDVVCMGGRTAQNHNMINAYPGSEKRYWMIIDMASAKQGLREKYSSWLKNPKLMKDEFYFIRNEIFEAYNKYILPLKINLQNYKKYSEILVKAGGIVFGTYEHAEKMLAEKIKETFKDEKIRAVLTIPLYKSYVQEEEEVLIKLIEKKIDAKTLEKHRQNWGWAYTNYASHDIGSIEEIKARVDNLTINLQKEKTRLADIETRKKKKLDLLKTLSNEEKRLIDFFDILTEVRDQRKSMWLHITIMLKKYVGKMAQKFGLTFDDFRWLLWQEQIDFGNNQEKYRKIIEERRNGVVNSYGIGTNLKNIFTGNEAKKIIDLLFNREMQNQLRGVSASPGKVVGKVRNIINKDDFNKFQQDEILIASHTTPDYIPLMKKASAILTERGGITSHAAIVSRELNTPCVVGINGLVGNFKDGDLIEVDANTGIIRIIKRT